jgi:hypothetical protein
MPPSRQHLVHFLAALNQASTPPICAEGCNVATRSLISQLVLSVGWFYRSVYFIGWLVLSVDLIGWLILSVGWFCRSDGLFGWLVLSVGWFCRFVRLIRNGVASYKRVARYCTQCAFPRGADMVLTWC